MQFAPSETVVLHPLRFVEPTRRGPRSVPRIAVARIAAVAAVVAGATAGSIVLEPREIPILALLPGVGRRLRVRAGGAATWPEGSLEGALQGVVEAAGVGVDLDEALRGVLATGRRLVPDVIAFVERGLLRRGIDPTTAAIDPSHADAVQQLLSDARERDSDLWLDIGREVARALRGPLLRHAVLAHLDDDDEFPPRPRRRRARDFLSSWRRLNRDPPSARGR